MITETFHLELITPCFCGGAEPETKAEIRAPSIRGQLRWWFRTLGGFKSLAPMAVPQQEAIIFGSTAGEQGAGGKLITRVSTGENSQLRTTVAKDDTALNARVGTDRGYLLFPLRNKARGVFDQPSLPNFQLHVLWRGDLKCWDDIKALVAVFGHLGSLGFRSRRAMGALAFTQDTPQLSSALARFSAANHLLLRQLPATDPDSAIVNLAGWLKGWRSHGRTGHNVAEQASPGFRFAQKDHDTGAKGSTGSTYRPSLGLPIIQFFSGGRPKVNWNENPKGGRFASPVILRPHRDAARKWHALVIFVDARKWPSGKQVYLDGQPRAVSLDLYEAMKNDNRLQPFP